MSDAIGRFDLCSSVVVAALLYAMARQVAAWFPRFAAAMVWTGIGTFLVVGVTGYRGIESDRPLEILAVLFVAGIAASVAALAAAVLLPPFASLWDGWKMSRERQEAVKQQMELALHKHREELDQAEAHARWAESERLRVAAIPPPPVPPPPPPPPKREERERVARNRYESSLRLLDSLDLDEYERRAGRDLAKQKLFQDLEGIL